MKFLAVFITCCMVSIPGVVSAASWTDKEKSLLNSMWLGHLEQNNDVSNRVSGNDAAVKLGQQLFFDKRFSKNGKVSCASCHQPGKYFTDGLATAKGIALTSRNTPTIVGSNHHSWYFHDGRADSLWSQALGPLENKDEHGGNRQQYFNIVINDKTLRDAYESLFGKLVNKPGEQQLTETFVNLGKAIAAYEEKLQPGYSRFDRYVEALNNNQATKLDSILSADEVAGLKLFVGKATCILCHRGPMLTDNEFHNIATPPRKGLQYDRGRYNGVKELLKSEFNCRGNYNDDKEKKCDELTYISTDEHETLGSMKTPSLRNVSKTAPYMHAGQYKTISEVLKHYNNPPPLPYRKSDLFIDIDLNDLELQQLEAFLHSLDSDIAVPANYLESP